MSAADQLREIAAAERAAIAATPRREPHYLVAEPGQPVVVAGSGAAPPDLLAELLAELDPRGLSQTANAIRKRERRHLRSVS